MADEVRPLEESRSEDGAMKVASLLYHDIVQDGRYEATGFQGTGPDRYKLDSAEFEQHLRVLAEQIGHAPATVKELGAEQSRLPWLLTFDDGLEVVKLLMTAYRSAEQQKTLAFPSRGIERFVPKVAKGTWRPGR